MPLSVSGKCPYCGQFMYTQHPRSLHPQRRSQDHIVPKSWGGTDAGSNIRFVCQLCNSARAAAGHCLGALACVRAVSGFGKEAPTMRLWKLPMPIASPTLLNLLPSQIGRVADGTATMTALAGLLTPETLEKIRLVRQWKTANAIPTANPVQDDQA